MPIRESDPIPRRYPSRQRARTERRARPGGPVERQSLEQLIADTQQLKLQVLRRKLEIAAEPYFFDEFCRQLDLRLRAAPQRTGRGRKKSKVTSADYIKWNLQWLFDCYLAFLPRAAQLGHVNLEQVGVTPFKLADFDFYKIFVDYAESHSKGDQRFSLDSLSFNLGAWFTIIALRNIVFSMVLDHIGEATNISERIKATLEASKTMSQYFRSQGIPGGLIGDFEKTQQRSLPNDMLRQIRKPEYSKKQILRFILAVKDMDGIPYVRLVAEVLKLTDTEVMRIYVAGVKSGLLVNSGETKDAGRAFRAKRRKAKVTLMSISTDENGSYFVIG